METVTQYVEPILPSENEAMLARETSRVLAAHLHGQHELQLQLLDEEEETGILRLPASVGRLLLDILEQIAQGNAVTLMPVHAELTTKQAADILNVSRPFLVRLLDEGSIPHHKVGTHRRVRFEDVMSYKQNIDRKRRATLKELVAHDQELRLE